MSWRYNRSLLQQQQQSSAGGITLPDAILALNPVSYWPLNDATTTIEDLGSAGANGTAGVNVALRDVAGPDGESYARFPGGAAAAASHIQVPHHLGHRVSTAAGLSVFALVRPTTYIIRQGVICKTPAPNGEWTLQLFGDTASAGSLGFATQLSNGNDARKLSGPASNVPINQWSALAASVVNLTSFPNYLDRNDLAISTTTGGTGTGYTGINSTLQIGCGNGTFYNFQMTGAMAHVAIFAGVLSAGDWDTIWAAAAANGWYS